MTRLAPWMRVSPRFSPLTMNASPSLSAVALLFLLACSATPSPNSSSDVSGGSGGNGGSATGGNSSAGAAGSSVLPMGGSSAGQGIGGGGAGSAQGGSMAGGGGGSAGSSNGGAAGLPPIEECMNTPSIDRLTSWVASGEGTTVPATGTILVKDGADYVGKVQFVGAEWHVIPVLIANKFGVAVDLSKASGFWLTYSATMALHAQLRSKEFWIGGAQWAIDVPSTNGQVETHYFSFAPAGWASLFDPPKKSFADTLKDSMGLVFVGNSENTVVFSGLRIDGYTPPCQ